MSHKNLVLLGLACVAFASGGVGQYFYPGHPLPPTTPWFTLGGALLVFVWYRIDSQQMGYRRSPWLNVGVIGLALVALPYYFFRTRGARRGFLASGLFLLAAITYSLLAGAGQYAAYYGLQS